MWLHLSEDECLSRGDYKKEDCQFRSGFEYKDPNDNYTAPDVMNADCLPVSLPISHSLSPDPTVAVTINVDPSVPDSTVPSSPTQTSLFQSQNSSLPSDSESDPDNDPNLDKVNDVWAHLMLELDTIRIRASATRGKSRGKKGRGSGVVLATPEMRNIKEKLSKAEKEYMFSRKTAGMLLSIFVCFH